MRTVCASDVKRVRDEAGSELDCGEGRRACAIEGKNFIAKKHTAGEHIKGRESHASFNNDRVRACATDEDIVVLRLIRRAKDNRVGTVPLVENIDGWGRKVGCHRETLLSS